MRRRSPPHHVVCGSAPTRPPPGRQGRERERYNVVYGATLEVRDGDTVEGSQTLAEWDPYNFAILTDVAGTIKYHDIELGVTMNEEVEEVSGLVRQVIGQSQDEKRHPQLLILDKKGETLRKILLPVHATLMVPDGSEVI